MSALYLTIDQFLRGEGIFATILPAQVSPREQAWAQLRFIVVCGCIYGAVMGSFGGLTWRSVHQILVSATKVPLLFLVTFLLCVPSFYVMNALRGLHADFLRVLNALLGFQSLAAIVLAALGPITWLMNVSTTLYPFIVLWNGLMFGVASFCGHFMLRKLYRPLVASNPRHALLQKVWIVLYTFVGIQMAWVLRPFIGAPGMPVQFFRQEAWGNAYVQVLELILRVFQHR